MPTPVASRGRGVPTYGKVRRRAQQNKALASANRVPRPTAEDTLPLPTGFTRRDCTWLDKRALVISHGKTTHRGRTEIDSRIRAGHLRSGTWHLAEELLDTAATKLRAIKASRTGLAALGTTPGHTPHALAMIDISLVDDFAAKIAACGAACARRGCTGDWVPHSNESARLGGSIKIHYRCTGTCRQPTISFKGTEANLVNKTQSQVGLSMVVGFIISGSSYEEYRRFAMAIGMDGPYADSHFNTVLKQMLPHTAAVLEQDIDAAKAMLVKKGLRLHLVTTDDGRWGTTGFHSQNATFGVALQDFLGALISYRHACMRAGKTDDVKDCPLLQNC